MTPLPSSNTGHPHQLSPAGWVARVLAITALIFLIIVGFIIAIPIVIALLVLGLILYAYIRIKMLFARAHEPNAPLDGRRNVRVLNRDD